MELVYFLNCGWISISLYIYYIYHIYIIYMLAYKFLQDPRPTTRGYLGYHQYYHTLGQESPRVGDA